MHLQIHGGYHRHGGFPIPVGTCAEYGYIIIIIIIIIIILPTIAQERVMIFKQGTPTAW